MRSYIYLDQFFEMMVKIDHSLTFLSLFSGNPEAQIVVRIRHTGRLIILLLPEVVLFIAAKAILNQHLHILSNRHYFTMQNG